MSVSGQELLRQVKAQIEEVDPTDVLDLMHSEQCYHRDIAPDNIMILPGDRSLLLDFGAARQVIGEGTQQLTVILKPGYAPVEQYAEVADMRQGAWTDIYALAAVWYLAIAGKVPPTPIFRPSFRQRSRRWRHRC